MAKSIPAQLSMFSLWTSEASPSATSSPESGGGPTPSASPGGQTTGLCGLEAVPASRSRSRAKAPVLTIQGTCGPTFIASSVPSGPLWYWENRLRERLATVGSTEFALIWKEKATPAGAPISQLSRSTPRTFASASTGSPSTWPTPRASDEKNGNGKTGNRTPDAAHRAGWTLPELTRATWPTPTKANGDGGNVMGTASATGRREDGTKITVSLPGVVRIVSTWPTPRAVDGDKGSRTPEGCEKEIARKGRLDDLPSTIVHLSGPTTSGSPDQTGNRGALNPQFPCWLMGFPEEFLWCAPEKMGLKKRTPTTE